MSDLGGALGRGIREFRSEARPSDQDGEDTSDDVDGDDANEDPDSSSKSE